VDSAADASLPLLNLAAFDELAFQDTGLQRDLLQAFLAQAPGAARDLEVLQDAAALREVLHLLKGSSQCIAADRLHALLQQAEPAFAAPAPADLRQDLLLRCVRSWPRRSRPPASRTPNSPAPAPEPAAAPQAACARQSGCSLARSSLELMGLLR
jgi:hypothetical protein